MATEAANEERDAYAVPSFSALSGRSKAKPRGGNQAAEPTGGQALDDGLDDPTPASPRPRPSTRKRARPQKQPGSQAGNAVTVNVSAGVKQRLNKAQAKALSKGEKKSHLDFMLDALNAAHKAGWAEVVQASLPAAPEERRFGAARAPRDRDYAGTGSEQLYVRMPDADLEEVEKATEEAEVPDRSKLIAVCLNWHLPGRKDRPAQ